MTYKIDANGLFKALIKDVRTGNSESLTITQDKMNLSTELIQQLSEQAQFERERQ